MIQKQRISRTDHALIENAAVIGCLSEGILYLMGVPKTRHGRVEAVAIPADTVKLLHHQRQLYSYPTLLWRAHEAEEQPQRSPPPRPLRWAYRKWAQE
eukprot:52968-Eustigmatos_ZCMA.PRE.1